VSPDSNVIGINYDGTTAGKKRQSVRNSLSPGIALIAPLAAVLWIGLGWASLDCIGLGALGGRPQFAAQATTTERVVVNRFSGVAIEGYDPVAYFVDGRPTLGLPDFEASQAGAVWRFATRAIARPLSPIRYLRSPIWRLRPGRSGARRHLCRQSPVLAGLGERLYLFGREKAAPPSPPIRRACCGRPMRAGRSLSKNWVSRMSRRGGRGRHRAAAGSPQAMNSGTMKSGRPGRIADRSRAHP